MTAPSRTAVSDPSRRLHLFSVDVEEHFQVSAFEGVVPREDWPRHASRVVDNTHRILDLLAAGSATATFFVLGWVAERHPDLVRRIADLGHEIGSHSWWHYRVSTIDRERFRSEVRDSKALLEQVSGQRVEGFRAPSFSIVPGVEWAFDVLLEEGYTYDSSVFPIRRPGYGYPGAPLEPFRLSRPGGVLEEYPMAVYRLGPARIPAAGGGYLRQFPLALIQAAFRQAQRRSHPGMFFIHPWEVDPNQPRIQVGALTRVRHYRGLAEALPKMRRLVAEFDFVSVRRWREVHGAPAGGVVVLGDAGRGIAARG